ncbi:MAG: FAD-binding oxidoreductase [Oscillospiraceae bacterium]|nr:FAD-binding oxidoreductase [Oscillospiraceae bacterium]
MADMKFDVAIVGGGVVGAAAAWKLSKAGAKVVLLEKDDLCAGASCTNPGFCVLSYRENPLVMDMALRQQQQWDALQEEIGDVEYIPSGGLIPLTDDAQAGILENLCKGCATMGLTDIEMISAARAKELEPEINEKILVGACWCPGEGRLNPFKLNLNMADRAAALGAVMMPHTPVTGFKMANGVIQAVETPKGDIYADLVVVATGAWTHDVVKMAGQDLPIGYERGEAMVSMAVRPTIKRMITDGALFNQPMTEDHPMVVGACLGQAAHGNIVMAQATTRPGNYNKSNTLAGAKGVANRVIQLFPALKDIEIIRMWAGLVSFAADHEPVFGAYDSPKNLFIANSFHSAIALSPSIGDMIADYWKSGTIPELAKGYTPLRFNK